MTSTPNTTDGIADTDPVTRVLVTARRHQAAAQAAEVALLVTAVEWAVLHPAESREAAATYTIGRDETEMYLAGSGAPLIDDWCVAEFAAVLHLTTEAGQRLIGEAVELTYRLPRLWWLVQAGKLPAWQARRVAARTIHLTLDAAAFVDRNIVVRAGRVGPVVLDRLIAEAVARYMPNEAERLQAEQAERRCFDIGHQPGDDGLAGQSLVYGVLDLPDALDLDAAITDGALLLKNLGDTDSLDVRRARAAGDLARRQPCLDLNDVIDDTTPEPPPDDDDDDRPGEPDHRAETSRQVSGEVTQPMPKTLSRRVLPRQVVLYLHLSDLAIISGSDGAPVGRVQNTQLPVLAQQIRDWIGQPDTHIVVKPVIDLNEAVAVDAYEIPDRIRERVLLRHPTCVFPWCHQPSFRTDLDHRIRYDTGSRPLPAGATAPATNPAAMCGPARTGSDICATTPAPPSFRPISTARHQTLTDADARQKPYSQALLATHRATITVSRSDAIKISAPAPSLHRRRRRTDRRGRRRRHAPGRGQRRRRPAARGGTSS